MGIHLPCVKFQPPCPQLSQYALPDFVSYTSFLEPPIKEKSELEKSIEAMREVERQFQNMSASPNSQNFQDSYSIPPLQNDHQSLVLDMSIKLLRKFEQ